MCRILSRWTLLCQNRFSRRRLSQNRCSLRQIGWNRLPLRRLSRNLYFLSDYLELTNLGLGSDSEFREAGVHNILDIGCGFGSFGAHLLSLKLMAFCMAAYETTGSQVQLALERGLQAIIASFTSRQLTFPSLSYDMVHCTKCGIIWDDKDVEFEALESLRDLCLRSVNLSDEFFEIILSRCFSLERFVLEFSLGLVIAKNTAPHLKLKSLELYICADLEKLEILAPNLVSFKYQGRQRTLCLKDAH